MGRELWGRNRPGSIACIGEAMIEIAPEQGSYDLARVSVAGDSLNTAVHLRRAWPGEVAYVTVLGLDRMSGKVADFITSEKISADLVMRCDTANVGLYVVELDENGERDFSYWRSNSAARQLFQAGIGPTLRQLEAFGAIYFSAITLAILAPDIREKLISWLEHYRMQAGGVVIFDSNYRPGLWDGLEQARSAVSEVWRNTDIGLPSLEDEESLFGESGVAAVLGRLRKYGVSCGALKHGSSGPVAIDEHMAGDRFEAAARVVDTTGAGDGFNGAYLAAWLGGADEKSAFARGHERAVEIVSAYGAIPGMHSRPGRELAMKIVP